MRRPSLRWSLLTTSVTLIGLFLILPTLIVVPMSFNASGTLGVFQNHWTTKWYEELFTDPQWRIAAGNSLKVAIGTTVLAVSLGTLASWGLSRVTRFSGGLRAASLAPIIIPPVILGVGLYSAFIKWQLTASFLGLIIAHAVLALPFVVISVSASFAQIDPVFERAALSLGASPRRAFLRVVVPLVAPGMIAGALFAFVTSWDEVVVAIFLTDSTTRTLPVEMWIQVRTSVTPTLAAIGTCLLLLSTVALLATQFMRKNEGTSR